MTSALNLAARQQARSEDFRGRDDLAGVSLGVLRRMKEQAAHGARESGSADRTRVCQGRWIGDSQLLNRGVECRGRAGDEGRERRTR